MHVATNAFVLALYLQERTFVNEARRSPCEPLERRPRFAPSARHCKARRGGSYNPRLLGPQQTRVRRLRMLMEYRLPFASAAAG